MRSFCINLDRRPDRWAVVREEFTNQSIPITRFTAIEGGWKGCRDSHVTLLDKCKKEVVFAIYEDDVEFVYNDAICWIQWAMEELPLEWDCLFLGASPQEPQELYSNHLYRLKNALTTHAIIWHTRKGGAVEHILRHRHDIGKFDVYLRDQIFPRFNCFLIYPLLATQRQTKSDTCTRADTSTIISNYNKYCK